MKQDQKTTDNNDIKITPRSQSNPISQRKTVNRLYGGYNQTQNFMGIQGSVEPLEVLNEFCDSAKSKKSVEEVFNSLNTIAVGKLGYSFTALGVLNNQSNYLHIRLLSQVGNIYSSRILLSDTSNPIVESFLTKSKKQINDINFINVPYINNSPGIIIPLINEDNSIGVLVAGSSSQNPQNDDLLNVLSDYLSLFIINKQLGEKANVEVNIDSLTGLRNHRDFQEKLSQELRTAEPKSQSVSIVIFDINNISQINREFGHAKGDEIICVVAEKIRENIRSVDIAGRYGGDEIAVILPGTDNSQACYIAEYLNHSISCCMVDDVGPVKVSIGVATYPTCGTDQEKLLLLAEQAMFISKGKGYQNGNVKIVSADDIDFWNEMSLDSFAAVIAKRHSQLGINFEDELVKKFHSESLSSNNNNYLVDVVTSLAGAIDAKDTYTRGHSQSVSRYAEALARAINLPEADVERIKLGALLHDVGKIGIAESILKKTEALSDQEWEVMKQHPVIGAEKVLKPIQSLKDLIPMVVHHHERWDGKGYPDALKGEEIPLGARIVSVADCFHALVSDRPYRKALSIDKAIEILRAGAGIQWDKELIRQFIVIAPSLITMV